VDATAVSERYRAFADSEAAPLSTLYAQFGRAVAASATTCALVASLPERCSQPNLLLAAVRFATGSVPAGEDDLLARVEEHWDAISDTMRTHYTQTNEAGRCAALLLALQDVPGPLSLIEIGASAGLCLLPDRYGYRYRGAASVDLRSGPCTLDCELRPGAPAPQRIPNIAWRVGLDQNPLDVRDPDVVRWLRCLVWPDMPGRAERLDAALEVAKADPPRIVRGDLLADLPALLDEVPRGTTPVVLHSATLAYVDSSVSERFLSLLRDAGAVRVGLEAPSKSPAFRAHEGSTSGGGTWGSVFTLDRDGELIASSAPHGGWVGPAQF
jgi:hypothetical protein